MGTSYTVKISGEKPDMAKDDLGQSIRAILDEINASMSTYLPDSELSLINLAPAGEWLPVSDALFEVLSGAREVNQLTGGYFDITIGPLVNLWGFGPTPRLNQVPDPADIERLLASSGSKHIELRVEPPAIRKAIPGLYIDLSAIAKGYAVDRIARHLEDRGIENFMVEIGGEIRAQGVNNIGFAWRIGIEQPETYTREVRRVVKLDSIAMATSGDYRNFFILEDRRYSHTINPHDGRPVSHDLVSVTVLHPLASRADALATGLLAMGKKAAWQLATQRKLPAFFIESREDGFHESYTPAFAGYLVSP